MSKPIEIPAFKVVGSGNILIIKGAPTPIEVLRGRPFVNDEYDMLEMVLLDSIDKGDWDESSHPRADDGKFGAGGGGPARPKTTKERNTAIAAKGKELAEAHPHMSADDHMRAANAMPKTGLTAAEHETKMGHIKAATLKMKAQTKTLRGATKDLDSFKNMPKELHPQPGDDHKTLEAKALRAWAHHSEKIEAVHGEMNKLKEAEHNQLNTELAAANETLKKNPFMQPRYWHDDFSVQYTNRKHDAAKFQVDAVQRKLDSLATDPEHGKDRPEYKKHWEKIAHYEQERRNTNNAFTKLKDSRSDQKPFQSNSLENTRPALNSRQLANRKVNKHEDDNVMLAWCDSERGGEDLLLKFIEGARPEIIISVDDEIQFEKTKFTWNLPNVSEFLEKSAELTRKIIAINKRIDSRGQFDVNSIQLVAKGDTPSDESVQAPIFKAKKEKQIVYGVVLDPYQVDTQNDWIPPEEIEKTAHDFMKSSRVIGLHHAGTVEDAYLVESAVESYPSETDQMKAYANEPHRVYARKYGSDRVHSGAWVIGVQLSDRLWKKYQDGEIGAFSIEGFGTRVPTLGSEMPEVEFVEIGEVNSVRGRTDPQA